MLKLIVFTAVIVTVLSAEIPSHVTLDIGTFKPDVTEGLETHPIHKKQMKSDEHHPVYREEEHRNLGRARIEPVRPTGNIVKHDMLADEPVAATEVNRVDNFGFISSDGPVEIYPDVPYAPGYGYSPSYSSPNNYDIYGRNPVDYYMEPDTSAFGLLWSQVPDGRTLVSYAGRTLGWVLSSAFVLLLGSFLTIGVCTYTNLCKIQINGVGPIHEEMRALMTPDRLEKISTAADFVKTAIDKYQKIQHVPEPGTRKRRSILY